MSSQRYQQVSTVEDEEDLVSPPQYSMSSGQTYYSGLPTTAPPPALNDTFVGVGDAKQRSAQDNSQHSVVEAGESDLEAQKADAPLVAEQPSKAWQTFETAASLAFAVWFCGLITWVIVKKA